MIPGIFGGVGRLEYAPQNGPDDPFPTWSDITTYVRAEETPLEVIRGRQTELDSIQSSQLTAILDNSLSIFTPGATPYAPGFDTFSVPGSNGWPNADTGQVWTTSGGTASNYAVAGGAGQIIQTSVGTQLNIAADFGVGPDCDVSTVVFKTVTPSVSGGGVTQRVGCRGTGLTYYCCEVNVNTSQQVTLQLGRVVSNSFTGMTTTTVVGTGHVSGDQWAVRFQTLGTTVRVKVWKLPGAEPTAWMQSATDTSLSAITTGTEVHFYSKLESGNTSTLPVTFNYSALQVRNPGLFPLNSGQPVRYSETIGERTFYHFTGNVEFPDLDNWQPIGYQELALSAVDRLTRYARSPAYVSTLAAHIQANGGTNLVGYWPLGEVSGPTLHDIIGGQDMTAVYQTFQPPLGGPFIQYGAGPTVTADDLPGVQFIGVRDPTTGSAGSWIQQQASLTPFTINAGQTVTIACWVYWNQVDNQNGPAIIQLQNNVAGTPVARLYLTVNPGVGYRMQAEDNTSTLGFFPLTQAPQQQFWALVAMRLTESTGLVEFWLNADTPQTFNLSGPSVATFNQLIIGTYASVTMAHCQLYVGGYTRAQHLAQFQMGQFGLEYQTTGARVTQILNYAGIPAGLQNVDAGNSFMSKATMAGTAVKNQLDAATVTEQGRLFVDGQGRTVFHGRDRVYNV